MRDLAGGVPAQLAAARREEQRAHVVRMIGEPPLGLGHCLLGAPVLGKDRESHVEGLGIVGKVRAQPIEGLHALGGGAPLEGEIGLEMAQLQVPRMGSSQDPGFLEGLAILLVARENRRQPPTRRLVVAMRL